ncbi:MAG TPA: hypothetical protein VFA94_01535 [Acidimicrobiales bacterium]|nr:hypothetical protein [Acidimicrobiales bacterium]
MTRAARLWLVVIGAVALAALGGAAFARWASTDSSNFAAAGGDSLQAGPAPAVSGVNGQSVTITWPARATAGGRAATGYTVARYSVPSGGSPTAATGGCAGTVAALTCTEDPAAAGTWYYTVTPRIALWAGAEGSRSGAIVVTAPSLTFTANQSFTTLPATLAGGALSHFRNGESVTFRLDSAAGPVLAGSISTADGTGAAGPFTVTIPTGVAAGTHAAVAVGSQGSQATGTSFTVVDSRPTVTSITRAGTHPAKAGPLTWTVTFSEPVNSVGTGNFGLATGNIGSSAPSITSATPSGGAPSATWTVSVLTTGTTGANNGSIGLNLTSASTIADTGGNGLNATLPVVGQAYTYDTTRPTLTSVNRSADNPARATPLTWVVTFAEPVSNVATSNFTLTNTLLTGTPSITSVTPTITPPSATWTVTVSTTGVTASAGTIRLNMASAGTVADAAANALSATGIPFSGEAYSYDTAAPTLASVNRAAGEPVTTNAGPLAWTATFSEPVDGVAAGNFTIVTTGTAGTAPSITSVASTGDAPSATWTVTVSTTGTTATAGTVGLNYTSAGAIADAAGNGLSTAPTVTGQTYSYDTYPPTVAITSLAAGNGSSKIDVNGTGSTGANDGKVTLYLCRTSPCNLAGANQTYTNLTVAADGTWGVSTGNIGTGTWYATATRTDTAGNTTTATFGPFVR